MDELPNPPKPEAPPTSAQPPPTNPRRAGTFRTPRPTSTPVSSPPLRRGATFATRPSENPGGIPRLRRRSSFLSHPTVTPSTSTTPKHTDDTALPTLRRGGNARRSSARLSLVARTDDRRAGETDESSRNDKAGQQGGGAPPAMQGSVLAGTDDVEGGGEGARCGMCGACGSMPMWAPERLREMTPSERAAVFRRLRDREREGRAEEVRRGERLAEMREVERRVEERLRENGGEEKGGGELEDLELESVDLGTEGESRRRSRSGSKWSVGSGGVELEGAGRRKGMDVMCGQCDELERKVVDLEEQLEVLRHVVGVCGEEDVEEDGRRGRTWKEKIIGAYFGGVGGTGSAERGRLRREVEALRKATDYLFAKMQN